MSDLAAVEPHRGARIHGVVSASALRLEWVFNAIQRWLPYKLPVATIVDLERGTAC